MSLEVLEMTGRDGHSCLLGRGRGACSWVEGEGEPSLVSSSILNSTEWEGGRTTATGGAFVFKGSKAG